MDTDTQPSTDQAWAHALSDINLASHLAAIASDIRYHSPSVRTAVLNEAAARLEEGMRA